VPDTPSNNDGQILFFFNSFENSEYNDILQPVLQFNNIIGGWSLASWYGAGGQYYHTDATAVNVGDVITGIIELSGSTWSIYGYVNGALKTQITVGSGSVGTQTSAQFAMEVYSVSSCNMYPPQNYVIVNAIELRGGNGNTVSPGWTSSINSNGCNANAYGSGSAVEITWSSGSCGSYTVVAGDTLYIIAYDKYHNAFSWETLCSYNSLANCNEIYVGEVLYIPNC
jgi:hypothetical protein